MRGDTYIDEVAIVSYEQISQYAGLVQVPEPDHVLDAVYRRGVHGLDAALGRQPVLAAIVVSDRYAPPLRRYHLGADGHIELVAGRRLDPYVITLKRMRLSLLD